MAVQPDLGTGSFSRDFVGRGHELQELRAGLRDSLGGMGRLFLVSGDPGIGKTRLADEICGEAAQDGAEILWGRCWEGGGAPAYWPWMQIVRPLVYDELRAEARQQLSPHQGLLAHLVPEIGGGTEMRAPSQTGEDPEELRFRLFDAAIALLRSVAASRPLVLILDDLHAADQASLLLLRFIARGLRGIAVLVLATYREVEVRAVPERAEIISALARDGRSLPLRGLTRADVARFIHISIGHAPSDGLVAAIYDATGGNPFFVDEVVRLMRAEGRFELPESTALAGFTLPDQVREAVRRQLRLLPATTIDPLAAAAVVGQEFSLPILERVTGAPPDDRDHGVPALQCPDSLIDVLSPAVSAGVIRCLSEASAHYRFAHALFRETLYEGLAPSARAAIHARVGDALEAVYCASAEPPLAELAHHYVTAGSAKGLTYAEQAANDASRRLAYEEAVHWYETALGALERTAPDDDRRRLMLRLELGKAAKGAADFDRSRREFLSAADLARALRLPEAFANAAIGVFRPWMGWRPDNIADSLLEESLRMLDPGDSRLRAHVTALLGSNLYNSDRARSVELIKKAVAMARRVGDARVLPLALHLEQFALGDEGRVDEALAVGVEALAAAEAGGSRELTLYLHLEQVKNHLWRGDVAAVDASIARFSGLATLLRKPFWRAQATWMRAMRASLEGRFREAEALAERASDEEKRDGAASPTLAIVRVLVRRETGDSIEVGGGFPDEMADVPQVRAALAVIASDQHWEAEARFHLDHAAARGFAELGHDWVGSCAVAHFAETCATLGERAHAAALYDALRTHAGLVVSFSITFCLGAAARYFGLLAATLEEWDQAVEHFEAALEINARMGARPWLAHTQHDYAMMLASWWQAVPSRRTPEQRERAITLGQQALATAEALGMRPLAAKVTALLEQLARADAHPRHERESRPDIVASDQAVDSAAAREPERVFRREGEYWTLSFAGTACRLKDVKGLTYIAHLLRHAGEEIHATVLVRAGEQPPAGHQSRAPAGTEAVIPNLGDAGEVVDARARTAYRSRIAELQSELDEAEAFNDAGRAAKTRAEMEFLTEEISRAVGLGGRARRSGSHAERARVNVTRGITIAIKKIAAHHPALARHLGESITTGTFCSYQAGSHPAEWTL